MNYITLHYITLHYITLHATLHYMLHYITLHYITCYITLPATLQYITLHYITLLLEYLKPSNCFLTFRTYLSRPVAVPRTHVRFVPGSTVRAFSQLGHYIRYYITLHYITLHYMLHYINELHYNYYVTLHYIN